ncbi:YggT family protein [Anoxybacterium hadale]|uniref:YggT family protein n=1 Tax=Anoxybacterium hadale TaxID=3408580 RepID=A0ACD1A876_9FIRM|nr:YggT family protein [Clostridiales bacterium]
MIYVLINAINTFFQILVYLIIGRAILSWFVRAPYGNLYRIYAAIMQITEPMLAPCRNLLGRFGLNTMIDFSPILAIIGLTAINNLVIRLLIMIF